MWEGGSVRMRLEGGGHGVNYCQLASLDAWTFLLTCTMELPSPRIQDSLENVGNSGHVILALLSYIDMVAQLNTGFAQ